MKIILFMAMSLNGVIARKSGDEGFLSHTNWEFFGSLAEKYGCFIVGRKTYDTIQKWKDYNFNDIDARLKVVISSDKGLRFNPPFILATSPRDAIEKASAMNFKNAILTGGSTTNSAFLNENLIDEVIINIEPAIIGSGIPLFAESALEKRLSFIESTRIADSILQVRYKVIKEPV